MPDERQRQPWDRQSDEPVKHYRRFQVYLKLGPDRSVRRAAEVNKLKKKGQHGAWRYWQQVAYRWQWFDRAREFDAWQSAIQQQESDRLAVQAAIKAAEDLAAWQQRQTKAHQSVQEAGIQVFARLLQLMADGKIKSLPLEDVKEVVSTGKDDRTETTIKGIAAWIPLAIKALSEGQRMEALGRGEVTDRTETVTPDDQQAQEIGSVIAGLVIAAANGGGVDLAALRKKLVGLNGKVERSSGHE